MLTTERMFEQLYRIARGSRRTPNAPACCCPELLRDLFEPMEVLLPNAACATRVSSDGSIADPAGARARRRRLGGQGFHRAALRTQAGACSPSRTRGSPPAWSSSCARAVAFDKAVEQGRSESAPASRRICTTTSARGC